LFLSANSFLNLSKYSFSFGSFYEGTAFAWTGAFGAAEGWFCTNFMLEGTLTWGLLYLASNAFEN
jgi:hypothetical protein